MAICRGARSQDRVLRRADRRLPQRLHRANAPAAARPHHAVAHHVDVAAQTHQQEPARGHRDLARDPERRSRSRRTLLRRSCQGGGGGRARHDRAIIRFGRKATTNAQVAINRQSQATIGTCHEVRYTSDFAVALLSPALPAFAQEYPSRPITMVVPFSAGGPGDVIARLLGTSMSATLKQSHRHRKRRRRRRHAGHQPRRQGRAGRLHAAADACRPGHGARALCQIAVRSGRRLCADRPRHRRADDPGGASELSRQGPQGTGRLCPHPGRQDHLWQCRPRLRIASVRTDVHEHHRRQAHSDLLQGRRPCAERHHRRSHRRLLRSRHRDRRLISRPAPSRAMRSPARSGCATLPNLPTAAEAGVAGVRRHHLVWTVCAAQHAEADRRRAGRCACKRRSRTRLWSTALPSSA